MIRQEKLESVATTLDESLAVLERAVSQLRRQIITLRTTQDFDVVSESVALMARLPSDLMIGRIAARLAREYEQERSATEQLVHRAAHSGTNYVTAESGSACNTMLDEADKEQI